MLAVLAVTGCGRGAGEKGLTHEEVVAVNEWVMEKAIGQPDSALMMIERLRGGDLAGIDTTGLSVRMSGPVPNHLCDYFRAKVYAQTLEGAWLDSAIIIGERLMTLNVTYEDLAYRQNVLEMLINACRQHRDDEQTIRWSAELIGLYRENGDETEALRTEADMGLMLSGIGRAEEGLAKIDSVLTLLSGKRKFNELDASIIALKRKVNVLKNMERYDDISAAAQQILDLLADYEQHPDEYHDGTYREPPEHLRPVYIDFYRAQAYMYKTEAEAKAGNKAEARKYLSLFENTDYAKTYMARKDFAPIYGLLGDYDKMLAIHDEQEARLRQQGDTVCAEYATILRDRAMAAEAQGRKDEALRLHNAFETLTATLNDRLLQGKANLYAARFHAAEQQREIERGRIRANRAATVATAVGIIALLVIILAGYALRQRRRTERKNRVLVERIDAALEYKKMYEEVLQRQKPRQTIHTPPPAEDSSMKTQSPLDTDPATLSDAELFSFLSDVIIRERLYLNPLFERQTLADRFHVSNQRIAAAFAHGHRQRTDVDDGRKGLPEFISTQRLEYACVLLSERPDMSIDEVATASGFSSYPAFARSFKKKYDVAPTEYRRCHPVGE